MSNVQNTQGGATKAPPIPQMDVAPAPPAPGREAVQAARDIARQARISAQAAAKGAQDAANAAQNGHTATTAPPAPYDANNIIPPQAVEISIAFFVTIAICVVGYPLARAFSRRVDRKTEMRAVAAPDVTPHIRQLQDSVDAMAIELERISEGQRFTAKLLADRSAAAIEQK